jgi:hypothetical protein
LCLVPYYSTALGVIVLVPSLLVSASNTSRIWFVRAYGEKEYQDLLLRMAEKSKLSHALAATIGSAVFLALAGCLLLVLSPDADKGWGYWFAIGILVYAFAIAIHGSFFWIRLFRSARKQAEPSKPSC